MQEIRQAVFEGQVAVCITLAPNEVAALNAPMPCYLLLNRQSYFPAVYERLRAHFISSAPPTAAVEEMWLDSRSEPLKWHLPVGVLYDLLGGDAMPWRITLHFMAFPEDKLLRLPNGMEAVKAHFMNALKEANFLKFGDGNRVMSLSRQDQDELWTSIGAGPSGVERSFQVSDKLLGEAQQLKSLAVRLVRKTGPVLQVPIKPVHADGRLVTLGDALAQLGIDEGASVRVQGVCPPRNSPLYDLQRAMSNPDSFLYCVLLV